MDHEKEFLQLRDKLRSYLLRLTAHPQDADDLCQETYLRVRAKSATFTGQSSFKTWVFAIATNLARDHFRAAKRWRQDLQDRCREKTMHDEDLKADMLKLRDSGPATTFDIREHIGMCFTCLSKTLPLHQQVCLMLKDIYDFKVSEVASITGLSLGVVKHALADARSTMQEIFHQRCSLVNKQGACYQCTELNGIFNPRQKEQEALQGISMAALKDNADVKTLFKLRTKLVKAIDPFHGKGSMLHNSLLASLWRLEE